MSSAADDDSRSTPLLSPSGRSGGRGEPGTASAGRPPLRPASASVAAAQAALPSGPSATTLADDVWLSVLNNLGKLFAPSTGGTATTVTAAEAVNAEGPALALGATARTSGGTAAAADPAPAQAGPPESTSAAHRDPMNIDSNKDAEGDRQHLQPNAEPGSAGHHGLPSGAGVADEGADSDHDMVLEADQPAAAADLPWTGAAEQWDDDDVQVIGTGDPDDDPHVQKVFYEDVIATAERARKRPWGDNGRAASTGASPRRAVAGGGAAGVVAGPAPGPSPSPPFGAPGGAVAYLDLAAGAAAADRATGRQLDPPLVLPDPAPAGPNGGHSVAEGDRAATSAAGGDTTGGDKLIGSPTPNVAEAGKGDCAAHRSHTIMVVTATCSSSLLLHLLRCSLMEVLPARSCLGPAKLAAAAIATHSLMLGDASDLLDDLLDLPGLSNQLVELSHQPAEPACLARAATGTASPQQEQPRAEGVLASLLELAREIGSRPATLPPGSSPKLAGASTMPTGAVPLSPPAPLRMLLHGMDGLLALEAGDVPDAQPTEAQDRLLELVDKALIGPPCQGAAKELPGSCSEATSFELQQDEADRYDLATAVAISVDRYHLSVDQHSSVRPRGDGTESGCKAEGIILSRSGCGKSSLLFKRLGEPGMLHQEMLDQLAVGSARCALHVWTVRRALARGVVADSSVAAPFLQFYANSSSRPRAAPAAAAVARDLLALVSSIYVQPGSSSSNEWSVDPKQQLVLAVALDMADERFRRLQADAATALTGPNSSGPPNWYAVRSGKEPLVVQTLNRLNGELQALTELKLEKTAGIGPGWVSKAAADTTSPMAAVAAVAQVSAAVLDRRDAVTAGTALVQAGVDGRDIAALAASVCRVLHHLALLLGHQYIWDNNRRE